MERLYNDVSGNIKKLRTEIGEAMVKYNRADGDVKLMAVTKTVPAQAVNIAIGLGIDLLGENKAQELCEKYGDYNKDSVDIHFIGHLQSNKVRQIIDKVSMIHSVDRISLAAEISNRAQKLGKVMDVLIEVNIGDETTKSGVTPQNVGELAAEISKLPSLTVRGLMTIPPVCDNIKQNEQFYYNMRQLFIDMKAKTIDNVNMDILSMGMSGDFVPAIKYGANIIRVGTGIFGTRNYN